MASESLATGVSARRILGDVTGSHEGPTVIFLAGVHGNEPAALEILEEIFPELENRRPQLRGRVVAICGNLGALSMGVRFIDEDLNRMWTPERVEAMLSTDHDAADASHEQQEQRAIFDALRPYLHTESGPVYLIDLHTTSAVSPPFIVMGDTLRNRKFAQHFHTPIILGLEERLSGTLLHYGGHIGLICMAFEAGQHQSAVARSNHRAAVWTTLVAAGSFSEDQVREFEPAQAILRKAGEGIPQLFEFTYHHLIAKNETFAMEPGFINFEAVNKGALLARNQDGPIRSPFDGYMFMPLYQSKGNDGFFLIRRVRPFWLRISEWLRRLSIGTLLPYLPGISRHPQYATLLRVNRRIARGPVLEICHLLGYRQYKVEGNFLTIIKRPFDTRGPEQG